MSELEPRLDRQTVIRDLLIDKWREAPIPQIYTQADKNAFQNRYDRGDLVAISDNFAIDFSEPQGTFDYRDHNYKFTIEIVTQNRADVIKIKEHIYDLLHENRDSPYNGDYRYWQYIEFTDGLDKSYLHNNKKVMELHYVMKSFQNKISD